MVVLPCLHALTCPSVPMATVGFRQTAVLRPATQDRRAEMQDVPPLSLHDPHDAAPLSPLSQSSSGYFSTSVSMVTLSDVLQTSSSSSSLLAADPQEQQQQQQGADRSLAVTSPPQCGVSVPPSASHSSADHNNVTTTTTNSEHKLLNSRGGGGGGEGFERLEIFVEGEEHGQESVLPQWLREGAWVTVGSSKAGTVRYVGVTHFAEGVWVGVELDTPVGRSVSWTLKLGGAERRDSAA